MANIASLRNEVEQHHFERSEKHHIAAGDASLRYKRLRLDLFSTKTKVRFLNDVCLRQMMLALPMMTALPNDVCLTAHWANIASLRNEVKQHHFERSEKHHIAAGDASFNKYMNLWYNIRKGGATMKENKLVELSMEFSVDIINLVKFLKSNHETIIANQIGRSGTSIGANIHEAQYAQGTKDFISKFEIALKEASETGYWLELLYRTKYIDEQTFKALSSKCTSLRVMLIASCKTAKENAK